MAHITVPPIRAVGDPDPALDMNTVRAALLVLDAQNAYNARAVSSTSSAVSGDVMLANATTSGFTITLPAASSGARVVVAKTDSTSNTVVIQPPSGLIAGSATLSLSTPRSAADLICDGTNWQLVGVAQTDSEGAAPGVVIAALPDGSSPGDALEVRDENDVAWVIARRTSGSERELRIIGDGFERAILRLVAGANDTTVRYDGTTASVDVDGSLAINAPTTVTNTLTVGTGAQKVSVSHDGTRGSITSTTGIIDLQGSALNVRPLTANAALVSGDIALHDGANGAITLTLPTPAVGARVLVKKVDILTGPSYAATVVPHAAETIDGASSVILDEAYEWVEVVSNGTNWSVVAQGPQASGGPGGSATYPAGGALGAILAKNSTADNDVEWLRATALSVESYGVIRTYDEDPTYDNSATFQAAEAAAYNLAALIWGDSAYRGKLSITIPAGTYRFTSQNALMNRGAPKSGKQISGLMYRGAGRDITRLVFDPSSGTTRARMATNYNTWYNVRFQDMSINSKWAGSSATAPQFIWSESGAADGAPVQAYTYSNIRTDGTWYAFHRMVGDNTNSEWKMLNCSIRGVYSEGLLSAHLDADNQSTTFTSPFAPLNTTTAYTVNVADNTVLPAAPAVVYGVASNGYMYSMKYTGKSGTTQLTGVVSSVASSLTFSGALNTQGVSDQFCNYDIRDTDVVLLSGGKFARFDYGGAIRVSGGETIIANGVLMWDLRNPTHAGAGATCSFSLMGQRVEIRDDTSTMMDCKWGSGSIMVEDYADNVHTRAVTTWKFTFGNNQGPAVTFKNFTLTGRHEYVYSQLGGDYGHAIKYEQGRLPVEPATFITNTWDGVGLNSLGARPVIRFRNITAAGTDNTYCLDTDLNWQYSGASTTDIKTVVFRQRDNTSGGTGGSLDVLDQTKVLPLNAVVLDVEFYLHAGEASASTAWSLNVKNSEGSPVSLASIAGSSAGAWSAGFFQQNELVPYVCDTTARRTIVCDVTSIPAAVSGTNGWVKLRYMG